MMVNEPGYAMICLDQPLIPPGATQLTVQGTVTDWRPGSQAGSWRPGPVETTPHVRVR